MTDRSGSKWIIILLVSVLISLLLFNCSKNDNNENDPDIPPDDPGPIPTGLLAEADFTYRGAFRLPAGYSEVASWDYGGHSMTFYPDGDPSGAGDGYPGSLFASGHAWSHLVSEISIPAPVVSAAKNVNELNTAATLQNFADIFDVSNLEIPRTGMAFLRKKGAQTSDKLHVCWGYHMQEEPPALTHGWCELNLANPDIKKAWYLQDLPAYRRNMSTNDYMFEIPESWAARYTSGKSLATGRFRDGGWSGQGPSLFAIGPWNHGNPPLQETGIDNIPLIMYTSTQEQEGGHTLTHYHHADEWSGGEWLSTGDKAAVIFVGTKGLGECWYGNPQGPCLDCENRGWWSTAFESQIIFYNPSDLAAVAGGTMQPHEPQPHAVMRIDNVLFSIKSAQQKSHLGACAFDRAHGLLYVIEYRADGDKPLVHVWKIGN